MTRTSKLSLRVWPLCAALAACGSNQHFDTPPSESGRGGATGTGGSSGANPMGGQGIEPGGTTGGSSGATFGHAGQGGGGQGGSGKGGDGGSGATLGRAGEGTSGSGSGDGLPAASSFTRLTLRRFESSPTHTDDCRDAFLSEWSFERESQALDWNFCNRSEAVVEMGRDTLSDAEVQAVMNSLSLVKKSMPDPGCTADGVAVELELEVDGASAVYRNSDCDPDNGHPNIVFPGQLVHWLEWRSGGKLPDLPRKLSVFTGESPPLTGFDCMDPPYPLEYELDVMTGSVAWTFCARDPETGELVEPRPSDSRVLDAAAVEYVRNAYAALELGVSGPCESLAVPQPARDGSVRAPRITIDDGVVLLDEATSCASRGWSDGGWAIGVKALTHLVTDNLSQ